MSDIERNVQLMNGEQKTVELPDNVQLRDLLPELLTVLEVPLSGPDGRPLKWFVYSRALGRLLTEDETFASSPGDDLLTLELPLSAH